MLLLSYSLLESICCFVILVVIVVLFIVLFNMTVVENVFNNKFGYSTPLPPLWTILLYKAYIAMWTFSRLPLPQSVHLVCECPLFIFNHTWRPTWSLILKLRLWVSICMGSTIHWSGEWISWAYPLGYPCEIIKSILGTGNWQ